MSIVLVVLVLGAVDLARVYQFATAEQEAARNGARHGILLNSFASANENLSNNEIGSAVCFSIQGTGIWSGLNPDCSSDSLTPLVVVANKVSAASCNVSGGAAPTDATHINVYWCESTGAPSGVLCASTDGGHDLEVAVVQQFSLVVQSQNLWLFNPNFPVRGDAHMRIQGC